MADGMGLRIAGFHIETYRGMTDVRLPVRAATSLIGANGAGKSSILEALGLDPSEEGALEREQDAAAVVWWYYDIGESRALRDALWKASPRGVSSRSAIEVLGPALVAKQGPNGPEVALDLFGLMEGEVPRVGADDRRVGSTRLRATLAPIAEHAPWARGLHDAIEAIGSSPYLFDLGVRCASLRLPDRPEVVSMVVDADDISALLYRRVERILNAWLQPLLEHRPALAQAMEWMALGFLQPIRDAGVLTPVLDALADTATNLLPDFVAGKGQLRIDLRHGPDSIVGAVERLLAEADQCIAVGADVPEALRAARLELRKLDDTIDYHLEAYLRSGLEGVEFHYARLGTGVRRWVTGAVDEAARRLLRLLESPEFTHHQRSLAVEAGRLDVHDLMAASSIAPSLRLIDEPVACLEPRVHLDVMKWLRCRLNANETLILATHQAAVLKALRLPDRNELVAGVWREHGAVRAAPVGVRLLDQMDQRRQELGLTTEELLFTARAALAVEGSHDAQLLRAMYGRQLDEHGVVFVLIGGSSDDLLSSALLETMYGRLRLPVWALLDREGEHPSKTGERQTDAAERLKAIGIELRALRLDALDILGALSLDALVRAFPHGTFPSAQRAAQELQSCRNADAVKTLVKSWAFPTARKTPTREFVAAFCRHVEANQVGPAAASADLQANMARFFEGLEAWPGRPEPIGDHVVAR